MCSKPQQFSYLRLFSHLKRCATMFHEIDLRPWFGLGRFDTVLNPDSKIYGSKEGLTYDEHSFLITNCITFFVVALSTHHRVLTVEANSPVELHNTIAQWITQSGAEEKRPFFDHGVTGAGRVVSVTDTCLDLNNCYFWDRRGSGDILGGVGVKL